jgi:hypothetical protein
MECAGKRVQAAGTGVRATGLPTACRLCLHTPALTLTLTLTHTHTQAL